jgi:GNAT superfamily N-acetyltransferase
VSGLEIRPLDASDEQALTEWHATYVAADTFSRDYATPFMLEELRVRFRSSGVGERFLPFGGYVDGRIVGCGLVVLHLKDNLDLASVNVWTGPAHRRHGHGSAMLDHLVDVARGAGRTTLATDAAVPFDWAADGAGHPDVDFATRRGFELDLSNVVRVLQLPVERPRLRRLLAEAAPHHIGYSLRRFRGPVPDDIVVEFGVLVGSLMTEAPSGDLEKEPEVLDEERIRADEKVFEESGRTKYTTVAVAPDGSLAAYTELVVPRYDPGHVYQWGTLVRPDHRGHRLGMATKVENLLWLQDEEPGERTLVTMNAEVNRHMVAVNEALGFRPVERVVELARRL